MDRKEFCDLLMCAKNKSGVRTKDILDSGMKKGTVYRIENTIGNFTLENGLVYISAINHTMRLYARDNKLQVNILCYADFLTLLKKIKKKYTERELAVLADVSDTVIGAIVRKTHIASIDTFLKLMEGMKYDIELEMLDNPNCIKQTDVKVPNSIFETDCKHCAIINVKNFFKNLIETTGWYKKDSFMYPQKAQHLKNKFHQNKLGLEEISKILDNLGYIPSIKIISPDGGAYFSDYATAYEILSKIYNINKTLGIYSLEAHQIKDGSEKRLRIDVIVQFLIKIGCDIDIKWELPESIEI